MEQLIHTAARVPWNKGKLVGQKAPLKLKDIWAIRLRLQIGHRTRELALFNLAIDSKLTSCDLVALRVRDVCHGGVVAKRAMVIQQKTQRPVRFEITEQTRESLQAWIQRVSMHTDDYLLPSRARRSPHLSTRQYARIVRIDRVEGRRPTACNARADWLPLVRELMHAMPSESDLPQHARMRSFQHPLAEAILGVRCTRRPSVESQLIQP
jgi:hypothetical protein